MFWKKRHSDTPHEKHHHDHHYGAHHEHGEQGHTHGVINPSIATTERGIWAIKWSFAVLMVTALFQVGVVVISGSIGLLANTVHNFGDAVTAIPLWIAFMFARLKPSQRFTYGYSRVEDLAGVIIVLIITISAIIAGYESVNRFFHPQLVEHLWIVVAASVIGFLGNKGVAIFRIKVGKEIGSAALIAEGYHARVDGWTSLAVLASAIGIWLGFPLADPIIGVQYGKAVFSRMFDGVEPEVIDEIRHAAHHIPKVQAVTDVRSRWLEHRLHAEMNIAMASKLSVAEGHAIAKEVQHQLFHHLSYLSRAVIHVDPIEESGKHHHSTHETLHISTQQNTKGD